MEVIIVVRGCTIVLDVGYKHLVEAALIARMRQPDCYGQVWRESLGEALALVRGYG